ncbi:MAG TPA: hypothetical protein VFS67_12475 [Polyangiaceae bacterium]|jgi:hypothetical protein|nr:hypothetical protein [Polyangiaceae bacterium]
MLRSDGVRFSLLFANAGLACVFAWAGEVLPSRPGTLLGALAQLLAASHAATLVVGALWPAQLRRPWRISSWLSLGAGGIFTVALTWTSVEMVRRFGSLGWGVTVLLIAIGVLLLLSTWPFALWGLHATRKQHDAD